MVYQFRIFGTRSKKKELDFKKKEQSWIHNTNVGLGDLGTKKGSTTLGTSKEKHQKNDKQ